MTNTLQIHTDDFIVKSDYKNAKLFQEVIENIKKSNNQKIETKFVKVKDNVFRIESRNFGGNSYTAEEIFFQQIPQLRKFADYVASLMKQNKIKIEIVNVEFGINGEIDFATMLQLKKEF
jgi:hypothetical protein